MIASRTQHVITASMVLGVAAIVAWLSFTQQPAEAFLFPRLISIFFAGLAVWNFVRAATGLARVGEGFSLEGFRNIAAGVAVMLVYAFYAAKGLGFFAIFSLYDPAPLRDGRAWIKRAIVTAIFMLMIYGLFALLLKVQTPRGMFI